MKVILKKNIEKLGRMGEVKQVRDGYARNYLVPRGMAEKATETVIKSWKAGEVRRAKRVSQENEALTALATRISAVTLSFSRPVSEDGTMYGSVAKSDIVKSLKGADIEIHKDQVRLPASIKAVGETEVEIALKPGITAKVKITVTAQNK
ncbi:MAG: large subunit ribosomal protein L9 [Elusimicrobia bacterium]|nr:MAG: large subunit ribosomal protein L9 [Elusimicrobiota bacterium]KAF0156037.1 MAG: large subunit ribosomal protein L9 [Elusimicrobiota bacterium]